MDHKRHLKVRGDDEQMRDFISDAVEEQGIPTYIVNKDYTEDIPARFCDPLYVLWEGKVMVILVGEYNEED